MLFDFMKSSGKAKLPALVITAVILIVFVLFNLTGSSDSFRRGVKIEGVDVSGLGMEEARVLLTEAINKQYGRSSISLKYDEKDWNIELNDISYEFLVDEALMKAFYKGRVGNIFKKTYDSLVIALNGINVDVRNEYEKNKLKKILEKIKKETDKDPENATIAYNDGNIEISEHTDGKLMDIDINAKLVENQLEKRNFDDILLNAENIKPAITYDEIKDIDVVASDFHTVFSVKDQNRSHNIRLACSKLDGRILKPGEEFSMNKTLGPRTVENGYKEAPVIFMNELIKGPGGGICQVTTTLYDTVLKAKLDVVERSPHSMPLGYVSPGQDATIAEGSIDFKFRNSSEYPVCISAMVKGGTIRIRILGKSEPEKKIVKLRSVVLETVPPGFDEIEIDDTLQDGEKVVVKKSRNGIRSVLYRETFSENNVLLEREIISKDYYKPTKGLIKINSNYMVFLTVEGYLNE